VGPKVHTCEPANFEPHTSQLPHALVDKVLELRAEITLQLGGRVFWYKEEHAHGMQVRVGGRARGHLCVCVCPCVLCVCVCVCVCACH